jgi:DNA polymerase-3 subunit alpha
MTTYSFNKSHAAGYSLQAYQDKWLKTYYPLEFYSSLLTVSMNSSGDKQDKVKRAIREANTVGVKILPPNVNTSDVGFTIDGNAIRFGLQAIKYVGKEAVEEIKSKRPFESYGDFYDKVEKKKLNKRVKKSLVNAGAFDDLGGRVDWILDDEGLQADGSVEATDRTLFERELMGFSVSSGDEEKLYKILAEYVTDDLTGEVQIGGEITGVREITDKKKKKMAFINLSYNTEEHDVTFFSDTYAENKHLLTEGNIILVSGKYDSEYKNTIAHRAISVAKLAAEG